MRGIEADSEYFEEFSALSGNLRKKIRELRNEQKLTQEDMEMFGLSLRQYQRIESGETVNMTLSNLFKISKALGLSISELLDV